VLSEAVLVILIDHPPPSGNTVFSEIGAPLAFDYRFAEHRFAEHEHEHDWAGLWSDRLSEGNGRTEGTDELVLASTFLAAQLAEVGGGRFWFA
jgi:hypothetical protein